LIEAIQLMGNPTGEGMMAAGGAEVNPCFAAGPFLRDAESLCGGACKCTLKP